MVAPKLRSVGTGVDAMPAAVRVELLRVSSDHPERMDRSADGDEQLDRDERGEQPPRLPGASGW